MPVDICESKYTVNCVHGTRPPCSCACPMNLNLREFMGKAKRSFDSAYRVLANELIFPEIATRLCGGRCAGHCAENIDIPALERAVIKYAALKTPPKFSISPKEKRIAVIGGGITGLACTLRLAVRGFPVTIFDIRQEIGGTLFETVDREICMAEFALQFKHAPYEFRGNTKITSLEELADYDAVFIATGRNGDDFGLLPGWKSQSMATERKGVWLGGELTGTDKIQALAQGRVASTSIEKYLLLSESMAGVEASFIQAECLYEVKNSGAVSAPHESGFDKAGAKAEAARCRQCDCTACYDNCAFMRSMKMYPPDMEAITRTIPVRDVALGQREGSRMTFSCAVCGHCGSVCPRGISVEEMFMGAKKTLQEMGAFPPQIHSYYIEDMKCANGEDRLLLLPEGRASVRRLFFPGCQAAQSGAAHIKAAYEHLRTLEPDTGLWLGCCGIPSLWAGDEALFAEQAATLRADWESAGRPVVVFMCPTCMKTFRAHLPEVECISLYELLAEAPLPENARRGGVCAVFDPCASREFPEMQHAVRTILDKLGCDAEELPEGGDTAMCCGNGGHIYTANRQVHDGINSIAAELSERPYVTYCENCRNTFLINGKENRHILDEVFGLEPMERVPHIDELRKNRTALRKELAGAPFREESQMKLLISDELYEKMDRRLISKTDVEAVIRSAEETHRRIRMEDGSYTAHLQQGFFTLWARYNVIAEGEYELLSAYSHKMEIRE